MEKGLEEKELMKVLEYVEGRQNPGHGNEKTGGWDRKREKRYKKGIIIVLFIRATPGAPASIYNKGN